MSRLTPYLILIILGINSEIQAQKKAPKSKKEDLSYYQWYGKRFDWTLDLYKQSTHKDSVHLFIREIGEGKDTFLVIHGGFGGEHSYLLDALLPLADKAHFIFYDQRGSLRSACPDSLISIESHVFDIDRIRKAFNMPTINIIAHSMGTFLAMNYLDKFPGKAGKVILISGLPAKITNEEELKEYRTHQKQHFEKTSEQQKKLWPVEAQNQLYRAGLDTSIYNQTNPSKSIRYYYQQFWAAGATIWNYDNWVKDNKGSTFLYRQEAATPAAKEIPDYWNFVPAIRNHTSPITIIKPKYDYLSPEIVKSNIAGIPNVTYIEIDKSGHNMWLEQPIPFRKAVLAGMKRQ